MAQIEETHFISHTKYFSRKRSRSPEDDAHDKQQPPNTKYQRRSSSNSEAHRGIFHERFTDQEDSRPSPNSRAFSHR